MINKLYYNLSGEGEKTIVLLHGWGVKGSYFSQVKRQFNTKAKCLIVDFYGFGESGEPPEYFDTYEYAYQIFLLLSRLGLDKIVLGGHSFGGRVAIILSSIFGIDICGLVLTSSAGLNRFSLKKSIKIAKFKFAKLMCKWGVWNENKLAKFGSPDYKRLSGNMRQCFKQIVNQDLGFLLSKINIPTKLFWAKDDKETPIWMCKKLKKNIIGSKACVFRTGGHFVYLKREYAFQKEIEEFVV